jgi:selenocysteine lyase/cysteine desulfurase
LQIGACALGTCSVVPKKLSQLAKPKVDVKNGALDRISLLHYNTIEEVDGLIEVLDVALSSHLLSAC